MLKVRIIPVLLFKNRSIVKSVKFTDLRMVGDPTTNARVFNQRNADEMIFLDILASRENREPNFDVIKDIARECFMPLTIGGGIKNIDQVARLFDIGADKVSLNTALIKQPDLVTKIANRYGSQAVVASIDVKKDGEKYIAYINSGLERTSYEALDLAKHVEELGAGEILLNSIDRDGTAEGYDLDLINQISSKAKCPVIACGGCGTPEHFVEAVKHGANAVSAATIFYYVGESIISVKKYMDNNGIPVRLR